MAGGWAAGTAARVAAGLAGTTAAAAIGWLVWSATRPELPAEAPSSAEAATSPAAAALPAKVADIPADAPLSEAPVIATWAVTATGSAVVSGSAVPESRLILRVDGREVASGQALPSGDFALLGQLDPNPLPSLMTLAMRRADGSEVPSLQTVALGPIAALVDPVLVPDTPPPETPAAVMLTDAGATLVQKQEPLPPLLAPPVAATADPVTALGIETITYTPAGAVQIGGAGQAGAALRLYLDNAPLAETRVAESGKWLLTLPEIAPGIYTLRVDALDAAGAVQERVETPFQRETPQSLALAAKAPAETEGPARAEPTLVPSEAPPAQAQPAPAALQAEDPPPASLPAAPVTITVQPGHSLWAIARGQLGEGPLYVQVFEANRDKIRNPDLIYPGQVFTIPGR